MSFDRKDFDSLSTKQAAEGRASQRTELQAMRQAAVASEHLMGTPEWDVFLSYLQSGVIEAAKTRDAYMRDLANPLLVDANAVAQKRIAVIRLNDRIDTLNRVMAMPSEIRKHGQVADERLKELAKLDEEPKAA